MKTLVRIIPRLDIKGPNLVKGVNFEGLRVLGNPESFARRYYLEGADELIFMDVVASLYGRGSLLDVVARTADKIFIPLTVGGGLRTIDDIKAVLRAGADKVALNTAAIRNPELIRTASRRFGSSTILVSIEAKKRSDGGYEAYVNFGRETTGVDALTWACQAVALGAGELMVTSIDNEGTGRGFDLELVRRVAEAVPVPVIAAGGAGSDADVSAVVTEARADAVALASILHYGCFADLRKADDDFSKEGNTEFLRRGAPFLRMRTTSIAGVKASLREQGIECRPAAAEVTP